MTSFPDCLAQAFDDKEEYFDDVHEQLPVELNKLHKQKIIKCICNCR